MHDLEAMLGRGYLVLGEHLLGGEDFSAAAWAALTRGGGDGGCVDGSG